MTDRPTDEQLREWLYAAQFDYNAMDRDDWDYTAPMPRDTFPKCYSDDYNPTLAALFGELLAWRKLYPVLWPTVPTVESEPTDG